MTTLTNEALIFAFNNLQSIGQASLPMKVSYAATRTKNNAIQPEIETFQEQTEGVGEDTEEYEDHLNNEIDIEVHNVDHKHLEGQSLPPQVFVGISFLFPVTQEMDPKRKTMDRGDVVNALNTLYRWSQLPFDEPISLLSISRAIEELRFVSEEIQERLADFREKIDKVDSDEVAGTEEDLTKAREQYLDKPIEVPVVEIPIDLLQENEELSVAPNEIEDLDRFLRGM